jgi:hypothetical protein
VLYIFGGLPGAGNYQPWDTDHITIDTAGETPEESIAALERALGLKETSS